MPWIGLCASSLSPKLSRVSIRNSKATGKAPLFGDHGPAQLVAALEANGLRPMQARNAVMGMFRGFFIDGEPLAKCIGKLGKTARAATDPIGYEECAPVVAQSAVAKDGTTRLLLRYNDGSVIETVIIVANHEGAPGNPRTTVCVSSQVGCGRGCVFCETARLGLSRQLSAAEIVAQLRAAWRHWQSRPDVTNGALAPITNVVFMGMGEPLDNLSAVLSAIDTMTHDWAFGLAARRITVSTVGVAAKIAPFLDATRANLALSLNAPDDKRRAAMMPVGKRTSLNDIKQALLTALPPGRDVLFEYILFGGVNDADEDADMLCEWLDGLPGRVNLIPANPGPDPGLIQPDAARVLAFQRRMLDAGVRTMVRYPHGRDVGGACGQLAGRARANQIRANASHASATEHGRGAT